MRYTIANGTLQVYVESENVTVERAEEDKPTDSVMVTGEGVVISRFNNKLLKSAFFSWEDLHKLKVGEEEA